MSHERLSHSEQRVYYIIDAYVWGLCGCRMDVERSCSWADKARTAGRYPCGTADIALKSLAFHGYSVSVMMRRYGSIHEVDITHGSDLVRMDNVDLISFLQWSFSSHSLLSPPAMMSLAGPSCVVVDSVCCQCEPVRGTIVKRMLRMLSSLDSWLSRNPVSQWPNWVWITLDKLFHLFPLPPPKVSSAAWLMIFGGGSMDWCSSEHLFLSVLSSMYEESDSAFLIFQDLYSMRALTEA